MAHDAETPAPRDLSSRRVIGFASFQAFVFFMFYEGSNYELTFGDGLFSLERADLFAMLCFMVAGFAVVRAVPERMRERLFSRPLLYIYAVLMAAGSLMPTLFQAHMLAAGSSVAANASLASGSSVAANASLASGALTLRLANPALGVLALLVEGALVGLPSAILLAAWGRALGRVPMLVSVCEVFIGSLVAALVCLLIAFVPTANPILHAFRLLPLASVANIEVPEGAVVRPATVDVSSGEGDSWSLKMLAGTLLFGIAAGLMAPLALPSELGSLAVPYFPMSMILYGAFLLGGLTLQLSQTLGRGASLNKSYRLAVFLMMAGMLVIAWPPLDQSPMPGESIVLAGFLGLQTVLVALFIVVADVTAQDATLALSRGFIALFAGEACGILLACALCPAAEFAIPGLSGLVALLAYVFLFTERDFDELSHIVTASDSFEQVCADIVERYGLSNRESEILAFALRGRTSERIASELVISKSTVDTHLRRIYAKCGVHSRQELLDLADR